MEVVINKDISFRQLKSKSGEDYSLSGIISQSNFSDDFFIHREVIGPGHSSSAPHYHKNTDEFVYILDGEVLAVEGVAEVILRKGDSACFKKGSNKLHLIKNVSKNDAEVLIVKKNLGESDANFKIQ